MKDVRLCEHGFNADKSDDVAVYDWQPLDPQPCCDNCEYSEKLKFGYVDDVGCEKMETVVSKSFYCSHWKKKPKTKSRKK